MPRCLPRATLLLLLVVSVACPGDPPATIGKQVEYTPPPDPDVSSLGLPADPEGRPILISGAGLGLVHDATLRSPVTALGGCTYWVMSCLEPSSRSLDDCFYSVPKCQTVEPWNEDQRCCPTSCFEAYANARLSEGKDPYPAFESVMFRDGSCMPGLQDLKAGSAR